MTEGFRMLKWPSKSAWTYDAQSGEEAEHTVTAALEDGKTVLSGDKPAAGVRLLDITIIGSGGLWKVVHIHQSVPNVEQAPGEYYPKRFSDQVESARRLALRMEDLALRDGLTQLYNYRGLEKM